MEKVLLVFQAPKKKNRYISVLPPLGTLYVASYLESKGIPADVIDCNVQKLESDFSKYSTIFFGVNISNIENTIDTIKIIKSQNPKIRVVIGGPMTINRGKYYLTFQQIDAVIIGEGEITAHEYLTLDNKSKVKGLLLRGGNGKIFFTGERPLIPNLDELPFPDLDKVPLKKYYLPMKKAHPISNIVTSRGCPRDCIFCFHQRGWRCRSARNVVDEIEWQVNELGARELTIFDANFAVDRQRVWDICQGIIDRGITFKWQLRGGIRADHVDKELLSKMKEAGLWLVCVAPETGNKETLRKIKKGFTLEQVQRVVKWSKELGLNTYSFFTMGYPWETERHLKDTLEFSRQLDTDFTQISRIIPVDGTPLYNLMGARPKEEFKDNGYFYGSAKHTSLQVSESKMNDFIKKSHRVNYLHPKKIWRIAKTLSIQDFLFLVKYSLITRSM